jgi:hypothetical protein
VATTATTTALMTAAARVRGLAEQSHGEWIDCEWYGGQSRGRGAAEQRPERCAATSDGPC